MYNNRNNVIKAFENEVFPFRDGFQKKKESGTSDKSLPNWVKADKERFNETKNQIPNATNNNNLQARPQRHCPIYFNESYKLIQDLENGKITYEEALKE